MWTHLLVTVAGLLSLVMVRRAGRAVPRAPGLPGARGRRRRLPLLRGRLESPGRDPVRGPLRGGRWGGPGETSRATPRAGSRLGLLGQPRRRESSGREARGGGGARREGLRRDGVQSPVLGARVPGRPLLLRLGPAPLLLLPGVENVGIHSGGGAQIQNVSKNKVVCGGDATKCGIQISLEEDTTKC